MFREVRPTVKNQLTSDLSGEPAGPSGVETIPGAGRLSGRPAALHWFALVTAGATLCLLGLGGLVTSHGVGMAVPDWPNTYGYNMFFFPVSKWIGGIFYEHTHRLLASAVGLLTCILALWLHGKSARRFLRWTGATLLGLSLVTAMASRAHWADAAVLLTLGAAGFAASWFWPACEANSRWLRRIGLAAFITVVLQGVLGGLRVVLFQDQLGIFHATLAQLFFVLLCAIALFTSNWWNQTLVPPQQSTSRAPVSVGGFFVATTLLVLCQLIVGASMRHQHAGLSIPDFPLAYGKLWPAMDSVSIAHYNQQRLEIVAYKPITAFQIQLQLAHRLLALLVLFAVGLCAWRAQREFGKKHFLTRMAKFWLGLILVQVFLGAATIWSNKAADVATAHVVTGALALSLGTLASIILYRFSRLTEAASRAGCLAPCRAAGQIPLGQFAGEAPALHPAE